MVGRGGFRVLGLLVSAVVLSGVLVSSVGAQAQDEVALLEAPEGVGGAVWSAALRVGEGSAGGAVFGYSRWTGVGDATIGEITSVRFSFEGVRNEVHYVGYLPSDNKLYFGLARRIDSEELALRVGGRQFALGDAEVTRFASWNYTWEATGIDWAAGDIVNAHLLVPPPADPATLGGLGLDGLPEMDFDPGRSRYDVEHSPGAVTATVDAEGATKHTGVDVLVVRTDGDLGFDGTDADPNTDGHQALLSATGQTLIIVKSDDGARERAYIVRATPAEGAESQQKAKGQSTDRNQRFSRTFARSSLGRSTDGGDATLASLALSGAALAPEFAADIHTYRADAASDTSQVTVTAQPNTAGAEVAITPADADPDTDGHQVNLANPVPGGRPTETTITVAVRSTDNNTLNAYTITVTRAAPEPPIFIGPIEELETAQQNSVNIAVTMDLPDDCTILDLDESGATPTSQWDPDCNSLYRTDPQTPARYYRIYVEEESEVRLRVNSSGSSHLLIRNAADGTVIAHDGELDSPQFYKPRLTKTLPTGLYVIEVAMHYPNHADIRSYTLYYSGAGIVPLADATLSSLELSSVSMRGFTPLTTDYSRNVAGDATSTTVTPTATHAASGATLEIMPVDADMDTDGHQVSLEADGETEITVDVTSPNGSSTKTYTVTLTELTGTTGTLSNDVSLSALTLSGVEFGTFSTSTTDYTYSLGNMTEYLDGITTTVAATPTHASATAKITPADSDTDAPGHQIDLDGRYNKTIRVTVTAQDGSTDASYVIKHVPPYSRDADKDISLSSSHAGRPSDIWGDEDNQRMYVTDPSGGKVFIYNMADKTLDETITLSDGSTRPAGIWSNGTTVWILDRREEIDTVHAYTLDNNGDGRWTRNPIGDFVKALRDNRGNTGTGLALTSNGDKLWAVTRYKCCLSSAFAYIKSPGQEDFWRTREHRAADHSIWTDGQVWWKASYHNVWNDDYVAYDIHAIVYEGIDPVRLQGLSFGSVFTDAGITMPRGMWSNGTTMWVLDAEDEKIYAFTLPAGVGTS